MKKKFLVGTLFMAMLLTATPAEAKTKNVKVDCKVSMQSKKQAKVTLKWKKQNADTIKVYCKSTKKLSGNGKYKLVATLSGSKRNYTQKVAAGKCYTYKIETYKSKNGKIKKVAAGTAYEKKIAVPTSLWDERCPIGMETTTTQIPLKWTFNTSDVYDGIEVYRSEHGKNAFTKIATVKAGKSEYKDTTVEAGKAYDYKSRLYAKPKKGNKMYGKYSKVITLCANNNPGKYTIENIGETGAVDAIKLKMKSDAGNGKTVFDADKLEFIFCENGKDEDESYSLKLMKYSLDGQTWTEFGKDDKIALEAGKEIYLLFADEAGATFNYNPEKCSVARIDEFDVMYNDCECLMGVDLKKNTATCSPNGEVYY